MAFQTMSGIPRVHSTQNYYSNTNPLLQSRGIGGFAEPLSLFGAGEQGAWWDFSDLTVMFQDSAGTVPAALESPIGKVLDKSGKNNHLIQATAGARPTLSRRYNSLPNTRNLGAWGGTGATASGTIVGSVIEDAGVGTVHRSFLSASPFSVNTAYTLSADIYPSGRTWAYFGFTDGVSEKAAYINLTDGSLGAVINGATVNFVRPIGNGGFRVSINGTVSGGAAFLNMLIAGATGNNGTIYNGTLGNVALQWSRPDVRLVADAALVIPEYQYADSTTVYDTLGFPAYLLFDGATKYMASAAAVNFSATAQLTTIAGLTKLSDAVTNGLVAEHGQGGIDAKAASLLYAPRGAGVYATQIRDAVPNVSGVTVSPYSAPITNVVSNKLDYTQGTALGQIQLYVDNTLPVQGAEGTGPAGNTTFGNWILSVGARATGTNFFNGRLYGLIVRGAVTNSNDFDMCNKWMGSKCGLFF